MAVLSPMLPGFPTEFPDSLWTSESQLNEWDLSDEGHQDLNPCLVSSPDCLEDETIVRATLESIETEKLTPILKQELKYLIKWRRHSQGQEEIPIVEEEPKQQSNEPRPEDIQRKHRRKELNRLSARRCRKRRRNEEERLQMIIDDLTKQNNCLREEIRELSQMCKTLKTVVVSHISVCNTS